MMTFVFVLAKPATAPKLFHQPNFTYKACDLQAHFKGAAHWDYLLRLITSRSYLPDKLTMVRLEPSS